MDELSQARHILAYMALHHNGITQRQASEMFGCDRLSARIYELRHKGYQIATIPEARLDERGRVVKRYARYVLTVM